MYNVIIRGDVDFKIVYLRMKHCWVFLYECVEVFLDLAKVFDSVSHSILLLKFKLHDVKDLAPKRLEPYLTHRKQIIRIKTPLSNCLNIQTGVPGATALGILLL